MLNILNGLNGSDVLILKWVWHTLLNQNEFKAYIIVKWCSNCIYILLCHTNTDTVKWQRHWL
jgi:hypothetical protein